MIRRLLTLLAAVAAVATACGDSGGADSIVLMTHDSFAISDDVLAEFTAETGVAVEVLRSGDAGAMVNQAILTKDNPLADVLYGIDNTFLSRALDEGLFDAYEPEGLDRVAAELRLDPDHRVTPIDVGDVCVNYDKAALAAAGAPVPETLADLTRPEYRGLLVVEDPSTSSPGLAFLLATVAAFGEGGDYDWRDYWADLRANDVLVTAGWEEAYFGAFTFGGGDRPLVVSYASSPPAEIVFAEGEPPGEASTGVVTGACFRQIEFAGVLAGSDATAEAREFVDFMLSRRFQEDLPLNMFVFPVNPEAELPAVFVEHTEIPAAPLEVAPADIEANRERWIDEWTEIVVR